jgi:hypothetical protein
MTTSNHISPFDLAEPSINSKSSSQLNRGSFISQVDIKDEVDTFLDLNVMDFSSDSITSSGYKAFYDPQRLHNRRKEEAFAGGMKVEDFEESDKEND